MMSTINLKKTLKDLKLSQTQFAASINLGVSEFNVLINKNQWPRRYQEDEIAAIEVLIVAELIDAGATNPQLNAIFENVGTECANTQYPSDRNPINKEYSDMLLRKQTLYPETRKKLALFKDPFRSDDVTQQEDVFLTQSIRYVREALYQTARLGGFIAVIGESGSGKSTLRKDLITRLDNENQSVTIIEPFVLGMEDNDKSGKTLKSGQIAEAIITAIDPLAKPRVSAESRFRQMHQLLLESSKSGNKHCLIIEEAHGLSIPTLKHLKRFYELEQGFTKMLSIVLIGQPELHHKLSERNPSVREVVQRCEVVTLVVLQCSIDG